MRYSQSRKKSCHHCSTAKTKCDLQRPSCARCMRRSLLCNYNATEGPSRETLDGRSSNSSETLSSVNDSLRNSPGGASTLGSLQTLSPRVETEGRGESHIFFTSSAPEPYFRTVHLFTDLDLVPSTDILRIGTRWLDSFIPLPTHVRKELLPSTIQYMSRALKSYPKMMLRNGRFPPIIHSSQMECQVQPVPLVNCVSLVRMWECRAPGSESLVIDTLRREMERLFQEHQTYGEMDLLAASQAYLIYAIIGFFARDKSLSLVDKTTMINLQDLASRMSSTGFACGAELSRTRPNWESWIVSETKRRTLYTMYMLDNIFNFVFDTPSYVAVELGALPAPASKVLWEATKRDVWEREYDMHLVDWEGDPFRLAELWPPGPDDDGIKREDRVEKWSASVDEYGTLLLGVCTLNYTRG